MQEAIGKCKLQFSCTEIGGTKKIKVLFRFKCKWFIRHQWFLKKISFILYQIFYICSLEAFAVDKLSYEFLFFSHHVWSGIIIKNKLSFLKVWSIFLITFFHHRWNTHIFVITTRTLYRKPETKGKGKIQMKKTTIQRFVILYNNILTPLQTKSSFCATSWW